jgi:altronate dehydratase large subunit
MFERMSENMDLNAGTIIDGTETIESVGNRIFAEVIQVASGKWTKAEILKQHDFGIWRIGPTF